MRVDGSFFEWMCVHVAHRLGQCIRHTEGLPMCAHDVNDMIQSLGFGIQGPSFGHQLFSYCVALALTITCPQFFLVSGSFPMSQLFASGSQSIGASASSSVLPINIHDWFPVGVIGLISLLSNRLLRAFSSTIIWKYQFFRAQPSLWSNSHIHTWLLENP